MCSLENINDKGELESKADIFTKRTIRAQQEITTAETPEDALAISISEKGHVDLTYMAELLGRKGEESEIAKALNGIIFHDPQATDEQAAWKTAVPCPYPLPVGQSRAKFLLHTGSFRGCPVLQVFSYFPQSGGLPFQSVCHAGRRYVT